MSTARVETEFKRRVAGSNVWLSRADSDTQSVTSLPVQQVKPCVLDIQAFSTSPGPMAQAITFRTLGAVSPKFLV